MSCICMVNTEQEARQLMQQFVSLRDNICADELDLPARDFPSNVKEISETGRLEEPEVESAMPRIRDIKEDLAQDTD